MPWSVLIVDDEPEILEIASAYLARADFTVRKAATGQRALDVIALQPPDLVVLDLMLPDIPGEQVCATIRRTSDVPIIDAHRAVRGDRPSARAGAGRRRLPGQAVLTARARGAGAGGDASRRGRGHPTG